MWSPKKRSSHWRRHLFLRIYVDHQKKKGPSPEFCEFSPRFVRHTRARRREPQPGSCLRFLAKTKMPKFAKFQCENAEKNFALFCAYRKHWTQCLIVWCDDHFFWQQPTKCRKQQVFGMMTCFFFFKSTLQVAENTWRSALWKGDITKTLAAAFYKNFKALSHTFRHLHRVWKVGGNTGHLYLL